MIRYTMKEDIKKKKKSLGVLHHLFNDNTTTITIY